MTCAVAQQGSVLIAFPDTAVADTTTLLDRWLNFRERDQSVTRGIDAVDLYLKIADVAREAADDDWDGEGARRVESSTVTFAHLFAAALPATLPQPTVSADRDGDIAFDWSSGPRRVFSISVRRDGMLNWAGLFESSRRYGTDIIFSGIQQEVVQYIARASRDTEA